jgi:hypothetical protein
MRPKNRPWRIAPDGPGSWRTASSGMSASRDPARNQSSPGGDEARERLAERQRHEQRREGQRAGHQGVVEHGHLDHEAAHPLRCADRGLERHVRPERGSADDRLVDVEVVEQGDGLLAERRHRIAPHVARTIGVAVAEQVETDHPVSARGEGLGHGCLHPPRQQEAVKQDHDARALAVLVVDEPVAIVVQLSSPGGTHGRQRRRGPNRATLEGAST